MIQSPGSLTLCFVLLIFCLFCLFVPLSVTEEFYIFGNYVSGRLPKEMTNLKKLSEFHRLIELSVTSVNAKYDNHSNIIVVVALPRPAPEICLLIIPHSRSHSDIYPFLCCYCVLRLPFFSLDSKLLLSPPPLPSFVWQRIWTCMPMPCRGLFRASCPNSVRCGNSTYMTTTLWGLCPRQSVNRNSTFSSVIATVKTRRSSVIAAKSAVRDSRTCGALTCERTRRSSSGCKRSRRPHDEYPNTNTNTARSTLRKIMTWIELAI